MRISDWSSDVCSSDLLEAVWLLAPLARVGAAADTVHGERERGVRFPADRAEAHRAGGETLHDLARGLHLLDRDGVFRKLEVHQSAKGQQTLVLLVDLGCEGGIFRRDIAGHGVLKDRKSNRLNSSH